VSFQRHEQSNLPFLDASPCEFLSINRAQGYHLRTPHRPSIRAGRGAAHQGSAGGPHASRAECTFYPIHAGAPLVAATPAPLSTSYLIPATHASSPAVEGALRRHLSRHEQIAVLLNYYSCYSKPLDICRWPLPGPFFGNPAIVMSLNPYPPVFSSQPENIPVLYPLMYGTWRHMAQRSCAPRACTGALQD
jgi:hypothetical protein